MCIVSFAFMCNLFPASLVVPNWVSVFFYSINVSATKLTLLIRTTNHIAHLRQQCHNNTVTTTVSQQHCHNNSVTTTLTASVTTLTTTVSQHSQQHSQQQCHNNTHSNTHNNSVTTTLSQLKICDFSGETFKDVEVL